jgi:hypothetical protein
MLDSEERSLVYRHAYLPEHLPDYVEALSGTEAHLQGNCLCYFAKKHLVFVAYPLREKQSNPPQAYAAACKRFQPAGITIIAPEIWLPQGSYTREPVDQYYILELPLRFISPEVAYMVRRAARELRVAESGFGREHQRLVRAFISGRNLTDAQIRVFKNIRHFLKKSASAHLIEVRKNSQLIAFSIVETGAADYAFYLFNFRSAKLEVPGASDMLFREMVNLAEAEGKKAINLGLGINRGIRRFKEKWGGRVFLPCISASVHNRALEIDSLAGKL